MSRTVYLEKKPLEEALELLLDTFQGMYPLPGETCPVEEALGRVAANDVKALNPSPHYNASAMDGVAVESGMTVGADLSSPKTLRIEEGFQYVDTGSPIPEGFDAVIKIEDIHVVDEETIEINSAVAPWHYVRRSGEDIELGDLLLAENTVIDPFHIGVLLAGGLTSMVVRRHPSVGILPTGSELVEPGSQLKPGDIVEFNSRMVGAMVEKWNGTYLRYPSVSDDAEAVGKQVQTMVTKHDLSIIIAGSSAGRRDFTARIIGTLGEVLVHGVNIMPGKPVILGQVQGKPVIGLPGYPVSAAIVMELFCMPLLCSMLGLQPMKRPRRRAVLKQDLYSKLGMEEFIRVTLDEEDGRLFASPLTRGASVLTSLTKADGFLRVSAQREGLKAGTEVDVELLQWKREW